jgi:deoxyadenosine/deoxycytidine kinase
MQKIITVMGLPGSGKTTFVNSKLNNVTSFRFEPTQDISDLANKITSFEISCLILDRMLIQDCAFQMKETHYRDSDYYSSLYTFGGYTELSEYLALQSTDLIYLKISPALQKQRILKRNRAISQYELMYCEKGWHRQIERAFEKHPAKNKSILTQDESTLIKV